MECEKKKRALTAAAQAVRDLRADGENRVEEILEMLQKLSEAQEEGEREKDGVGTQREGSPTKRIRSEEPTSLAGTPAEESPAQSGGKGTVVAVGFGRARVVEGKGSRGRGRKGKGPVLSLKK